MFYKKHSLCETRDETQNEDSFLYLALTSKSKANIKLIDPQIFKKTHTHSVCSIL